MMKKIALLAASMTSALVLAGGLALAGFGAPGPAADMQSVDQAVSAGATPGDGATPADGTPTAQVDAIDLAPQAVPAETAEPVIKEATQRANEVESAQSGEHGESEDD